MTVTTEKPVGADIRPFHVNFPEAELVELCRRLEATRRPEKAGKYECRLITGGIGHNLPQEAPTAFAKAVIDVDGF
jgi:hypothetical protein